MSSNKKPRIDHPGRMRGAEEGEGGGGAEEGEAGGRAGGGNGKSAQVISDL